MNSSKLLKCFSAATLIFSLPSIGFAQHYTQTNLVSNVPVTPAAAVIDPNLLNAWGLVHSPTSPWWISNNAGGTSTLYDTSGLNPPNPATQTPTPTLEPVVIVPLNAPGGTTGNGVVIPNAPGQSPPGTPTSVLFNGNPNDFLASAGMPAVFIWVTEDGTVQAWNPMVNAKSAIIMVDNSQKPTKQNGAVYKGGTIVQINGMAFLLAANFRSGAIDVFDPTFAQVTISPGAFVDSQIPAGFAPFNVQGIGQNVYVTYAQQDAAKHDPVSGAGLGFVTVFSSDGKVLARLQNGNWFNAPWGVTLTTADFGTFSHTLLVGNFLGGNIAAFNPLTNQFIGDVQRPDGSTLTIDGLWSLVFGGGGMSRPGDTLFFTAGPNNETNGLFGTLTPVAVELNAVVH